MITLRWSSFHWRGYICKGTNRSSKSCGFCCCHHRWSSYCCNKLSHKKKQSKTWCKFQLLYRSSKTVIFLWFAQRFTFIKMPVSESFFLTFFFSATYLMPCLLNTSTSLPASNLLYVASIMTKINLLLRQFFDSLWTKNIFLSTCRCETKTMIGINMEHK